MFNCGTDSGRCKKERIRNIKKAELRGINSVGKRAKVSMFKGYFEEYLTH